MTRMQLGRSLLGSLSLAVSDMHCILSSTTLAEIACIRLLRKRELPEAAGAELPLSLGLPLLLLACCLVQSMMVLGHDCSIGHPAPLHLEMAPAQSYRTC